MCDHISGHCGPAKRTHTISHHNLFFPLHHVNSGLQRIMWYWNWWYEGLQNETTAASWCGSQLPSGRTERTSFVWQQTSISDHRTHRLSHHVTSGRRLLNVIKWNLTLFVNIKGRIRLLDCRLSLLTLLFVEAELGGHVEREVQTLGNSQILLRPLWSTLDQIPRGAHNVHCWVV